MNIVLIVAIERLNIKKVHIPFPNFIKQAKQIKEITPINLSLDKNDRLWGVGKVIE